MPKMEPKEIQRELEQGWIWPVYWIHGQERMKSRELVKRIRQAVLDGETGGFGFGGETLEGGEISASQVLDSAQSLMLGGGIRFLIIRDAHAIKEAEQLAPLLGPRARREDLTSVCVFISKDLDGRKKFSKLLAEKAAVVACEEVAEEDREAWLGYLSKRKGVTLRPEQIVQLRSLDPWNLDIADQEIEKLSLMEGDPEAEDAGISLGASAGNDDFIEAFMSRDLRRAFSQVENFADSPDLALPLLGLLGWNVRHLALVCADREQRNRVTRLSPFLAERFERWGRVWSIEEVIRLQGSLAEVDFDIKQTARLPLALWSHLVIEFCEDRATVELEK